MSVYRGSTLIAGGASPAAIATQAEAEAGTDNAVLMSPLRVAQAFAALQTPNIEVVAALPGAPDPNTIYFVTA